MVGILYVVLGIIIIFFEIQRKKNTYIDYLTMFNIYFIGYYVIPAIISNLFDDYVSRYALYIGNQSGSLYAFCLISISYVSVNLGYLRKFRIGKLVTWRTSGYKRKIKNEYGFFCVLSISLLLIGIVSLVLYSIMYGGISKTLMNAALIRNKTYEITTGNTNLEFVSRFIICLQFFAYFKFAEYIDKKTNKLVLIFAMMMASLYLVVNAGRGAILTFILVLVFANYLYTEKKVKLRTWVIITLLIAIGIIYLRPLLTSLSSLKDGFSTFISEFSRRAHTGKADITSIKDMIFNVSYYLEHKYVSLETAINAIAEGRYEFNFFVDIWAAAIAVFPSVILPFSKPNSIDTYNTMLILGTTANGVIPPGGVAFGYYSLGLVGVIIFSFFVGIVGKRTEIFFDSFDSRYMSILKTVNMFVWIDLFINGELREWVLRYFIFICIMIVIFMQTSTEISLPKSSIN